MSYKYDPYTDSFTHIADESPTYVSSIKPDNTVPFAFARKCDLTDACIEKIAEVVVRKLRESTEHEIHVDLTPREKSG